MYVDNTLNSLPTEHITDTVSNRIGKFCVIKSDKSQTYRIYHVVTL
jgi:hypothetical protein